ncbi:response regulator [Geobacter sp. DSM 9736]|uniref:response regulator n=1 Tax=Geobacter sp. DSM 9736 TaxID=1277350 RepID=UPI000B5E6B58|nr:response regulator [Geobacter sp. DSM 9736]SNB45394.1 two-component system, cell cycle response regulator CpdR [Geobacter sp. DSM 9736]
MENATVLVVDDDHEILLLLKNAFARYGVPVDCLSSGEEAIALLDTDAGYSILLTDLNMEEMDGIELARQAKAIVPEIRIMLITGAPVDDKASQIAEAGIERVFEKPVSVEDLLDDLNLLPPKV